MLLLIIMFSNYERMSKEIQHHRAKGVFLRFHIQKLQVVTVSATRDEEKIVLLKKILLIKVVMIKIKS